MTIIRHPTVRLIVAIMCVLISFGLIRSLWDTWRSGDQVGERRAVLKTEQQKHDELTQQLQEATSPAFIEKEARNKLGLVKDGETVILMGTPAPGTQEPQNTTQTPMTRWQLWWRLFF